MNWDKLIFGSFDREVIRKAVDSDVWQKFRKSLKGIPLDAKYYELERYLKQHNHSWPARIQVTNYINALKRSGLIK